MNQTIPIRRFGLISAILLVVYTAGLCRDLREPWVGLHDWNGAFFSQLARNLLRYPFSLHHGMPMVAVGEQLPAGENRSFYPRHPPALPWILAGVFAFAGDSEAIARCVPIAASLATLWLMIGLIRRRDGDVTALLAALFFSMMPMTVYFGRMVDHEPLCLFFMLASAASMDQAIEQSRNRRPWKLMVALSMLSLAAMIWTDWPGILFALAYPIVAARQNRQSPLRRATLIWAPAVALMSVAMLVAYLVQFGFDGKGLSLIAMFSDRRTDAGIPMSRAWEHVVNNLSWPVLVASVGGCLLKKTRSHDRLDWLTLVTLTACAWMALFFRQFLLHPYWMYYLAPFLCVSAARFVIWLGVLSLSLSAHTRVSLITVGLVVVVVFALRGSSNYFSRVSCPAVQIEAWKRVNALTPPNSRAILNWEPVAIERHGEFVFRNVVPAQLAYYMDRAFEVNSDLTAMVARVQQGAPALIVNPPVLHEGHFDFTTRAEIQWESWGPFAIGFLPRESSR
ncbi:MAG: glycosyltransferase family 39 protein [Planctomycetes bacterium]|nr:glycosyltransferase family 39 protein [Planctomycetota bacterium]